uniref:Uncharacterized protein n=1 Tax=Panagrolaimus sp. ES5 TaxID=591445 RepID=A0AC34FJT0_9BILA
MQNANAMMDNIDQLCENANDFVTLKNILESEMGQLDIVLTQIKRIPPHRVNIRIRKETTIQRYCDLVKSAETKLQKFYILHNKNNIVKNEKLRQTLDENYLQIQQLQLQISELQLQKKQ